MRVHIAVNIQLHPRTCSMARQREESESKGIKTLLEGLGLAELGPSPVEDTPERGFCPGCAEVSNMSLPEVCAQQFCRNLSVYCIQPEALWVAFCVLIRCSPLPETIARNTQSQSDRKCFLLEVSYDC